MTPTEVENLVVRVTAEVEQYHAKMREVEKRNEEMAAKMEAASRRLKKTSFFTGTEDMWRFAESWEKFGQRFGMTAAKIGSDLDYHVYRRMKYYGSQFTGSSAGNFLFGGFQSSPVHLFGAGLAAATTYGSLAVRAEERDLDRYNSEGGIYDSQIAKRLGRRESIAKSLTDSMSPGERLIALKEEERIKQLEATGRANSIRALDDQIKNQKMQAPEWAKSFIGPGFHILDKLTGGDSSGAVAEGLRATPFGADQRVELERLEKQREELLKKQVTTQDEILRRQQEIAELEGKLNTNRTIWSNTEQKNLHKELELIGKKAYESKLYDMQELKFTPEQIQAQRVLEQRVDLERTLLGIQRERAMIGMTADQRAAYEFDPQGKNGAGAAAVQAEALRLQARRTAEDFQSPFEKYQKRVADLNNQKSVGLTQEAYNRALEDARKKYNAAASAAYGFGNAINSVNALSGSSSAGVAAVRNYLGSMDTSRFEFGAPNAVPKPVFNGNAVTAAQGEAASATALLTQIRDSLRIIAKQPQVVLQPAGGGGGSF